MLLLFALNEIVSVNEKKIILTHNKWTYVVMKIINITIITDAGLTCIKQYKVNIKDRHYYVYTVNGFLPSF